MFMWWEGRVEHPNMPWWAISLYFFNKSLSNLAVLLISRRSFQWCQQIFPNWSMSKVSPFNSHGLTVKLTVWAVNSRCHDLASKSDSETENLKIAGQVSRHDPLHWNDDLWFLLITKFVNKFLFSSVNYRKLKCEQSRQLDWTKFLFSDFSSSF